MRENTLFAKGGSMAKIEFGTALPTVTGTAEFARKTEELGYDFLGCGEHVMFHGPVSNTFISLSVAAGVTKKIKLLSSIVLLPLYPAALVAKMGAALDVASGGRYNFGVGIGGEFPKEFEACGVPVNQRGARTNTETTPTHLGSRTQGTGDAPHGQIRGRLDPLHVHSAATPRECRGHLPLRYGVWPGYEHLHPWPVYFCYRARQRRRSAADVR